MELVYDYVSEERKEEVKKMGILTPYGGLFEPREKFGNLKYVKSKDEYYLFKRIIPGVEYSEYENDGIRYLFICGKRYYYVELPIEDNIIKNERKDGVFYVYETANISEIKELTDEEIAVLVNALSMELKQSALYNKDLKVYCTIYYNKKLMMKEF